MLRTGLAALIVVVLTPCSPSYGGESGVSVGVTGVELLQGVAVRVRVGAGGASVAVPDCGDRANTHLEPCPSAIWLEVESNGGWKALRSSRLEAALAVHPQDRWKGRVVPAGGAIEFTAFFNKEYWPINRGDRLRIVLKAWATEQAMRANLSSESRTGPPFACP